MKISLIYLILFCLFPNAGNTTNLEKLGGFNTLDDLSKVTFELDIQALNGESQKVVFDLTDDAYQEMLKFKGSVLQPKSEEAKSPGTKDLVKSTQNSRDIELLVFRDISPTSFKVLNLNEQTLWLDPNIFQFEVQILKQAGQTQDLVAFVKVKVKGEVVASGQVKEKKNLNMSKSPYVDGNQQLETVSVTANQLATDRRFFELDFELNRALVKQKFRVKIDLNKITYTSRLSNQNTLEEAEPENSL